MIPTCLPVDPQDYEEYAARARGIFRAWTHEASDGKQVLYNTFTDFRPNNYNGPVHDPKTITHAANTLFAIAFTPEELLQELKMQRGFLQAKRTIAVLSIQNERARATDQPISLNDRKMRITALNTLDRYIRYIKYNYDLNKQIAEIEFALLPPDDHEALEDVSNDACLYAMASTHGFYAERGSAQLFSRLLDNNKDAREFLLNTIQTMPMTQEYRPIWDNLARRVFGPMPLDNQGKLIDIIAMRLLDTSIKQDNDQLVPDEGCIASICYGLNMGYRNIAGRKKEQVDNELEGISGPAKSVLRLYNNTEYSGSGRFRSAILSCAYTLLQLLPPYLRNQDDIRQMVDEAVKKVHNRNLYPRWADKPESEIAQAIRVLMIPTAANWVE